MTLEERLHRISLIKQAQKKLNKERFKRLNKRKNDLYERQLLEEAL